MAAFVTSCASIGLPVFVWLQISNNRTRGKSTESKDGVMITFRPVFWLRDRLPSAYIGLLASGKLLKMSKSSLSLGQTSQGKLYIEVTEAGRLDSSTWQA